MALTCCRGTLFECSTISFVLVLSIADFAGLGSAACVTQATKFSKNMSESHVQILVALGKAIQRHPRRAATNEDHIAPGNRWCRLCDKGPKWCCACECPECGLPPLKCHCGAIDPYDVYPIRASWDNDWHTTGYHRDFRNGVRALVLKARAAIEETQSSTLAPAEAGTKHRIFLRNEKLEKGACIIVPQQVAERVDDGAGVPPMSMRPPSDGPLDFPRWMLLQKADCGGDVAEDGGSDKWTCLLCGAGVDEMDGEEDGSCRECRR